MVTDFDEASRGVWNQMRAGTAYQQPGPDTGEYTADFWGAKAGEEIKFEELVIFLANTNKNNDPTQIFDWNDYKAYLYVAGSSITTNMTTFSYTDQKGKKVDTFLTGRLNKRVGSLDYNAYDTGLLFNIDADKKTTSASLLYYYSGTKVKRKKALETEDKDDYRIEDKYLAVEITSPSFINFYYLTKFIFNNNKDVNSSIPKWIAKKIAKELKSTNKEQKLNFLYKSIPDLPEVFAELKKNVSADLVFSHLAVLKQYDESSWFKDSSNAVVNLLKLVGNSKTLYTKFRDNPVLVKQLYNNLNGESIHEGTPISNAMIFACLMWMLCVNQQFEGFSKPTGRFYKGNGYKLDSNLSDSKGPTIFLQQYIPESVTHNVTIYDDLPGQSLRYEVTEVETVERDKGAYYHPFERVYLTDKDTNETYIVPALYVKALSDEAEWKEIERSIRIGVDVLAIVLSVASLGAGTPLLTALAVTDIALSAADIAVAFMEEGLEKTPEGQKFLAGWNKFMLAGGAITGLPAIGATITAGARLFSKATLNASKDFLRASMLRMLLEIEVAGFTKNTLKIIEPTEIFAVGAEYINRANKLWEEGVVFVEGAAAGSQIQKIYGVIYNGEVIAKGTKLEITKELQDVWTLSDEALVEALNNLIPKALNHTPSWMPARIIKSQPRKTVTLIGSFKKDTDAVLKELNYAETLDFGAKPGEFNLLNVPQDLAKKHESVFWNKFNKPWLIEATERGDDIIVLSDMFDTSILLRPNGAVTGFGNEINFMESLVKKKTYKFVKEEGKYIKKD